MTSLPRTAISAEAVVLGGCLSLSGGHVMHFEDRGNADDRMTALVLHGGPGSSISARLCEQVLRAGAFRVIAFDQRGCGASTPRGAVHENTTGHLIADIERLRRHLGIERWLVVGGSWGATLALAYASRHRDVVDGVLLRALFVPTATAIHRFFHGAISPAAATCAAWDAVAPAGACRDVLPWLHDVFHGNEPALQARVARIWLEREHVLSGLPPPPKSDDAATTTLVDRYRVQTHYLVHQCWLDASELLRAGAQVTGLPVTFLHGSRDAVCEPEAARTVHRACPGSRWIEIPDDGHDPFSAGMEAAMNGALRRHAMGGTFAAPIENP